MAIPDGTLYHGGPHSAGSPADVFDDHTVNTEHAGDAINFGSAVVLKDGDAVTASQAPIYGIALKRTYVDAADLTEESINNDKWKAGETLGVAREGTWWVPISEDVNRGDNATVDANGKFKPASSSDKIVGMFLSDGDKGSTATVQIRVQLEAGVSTNSSTTPSQSTNNSTENNTSGEK